MTEAFLRALLYNVMYAMYSSTDSAASTTSSTGSTAIHAYLPDDTPSWLQVEDLSAPTHSACAALLPSGEWAMDNSEQHEELVVAVYNKDPQHRWHDFTVYKLLLRGKFTCVIACVYQWYTARSMVYIYVLYLRCIYTRVKEITGPRVRRVAPARLRDTARVRANLC